MKNKARLVDICGFLIIEYLKYISDNHVLLKTVLFNYFFLITIFDCVFLITI